MLVITVILLMIIIIIGYGHTEGVYKYEPDFYYPKPYQHVYVIYERDAIYAAIYHPSGFWIIDNSEIDDDKIIAWKLK